MGQAGQQYGRGYSKGVKVEVGRGETEGGVMAALEEIGDETQEDRGGEVWNTLQ